MGEKARFAARRNLRIVGSLKVARECDGKKGLVGWMDGWKWEMSGRNGGEENPRIVK